MCCSEPWDDEMIEQLVQELADIGVQLEAKRTWPKTLLEPLADDTTRSMTAGTRGDHFPVTRHHASKRRPRPA
jgi:hypothetical protein